MHRTPLNCITLLEVFSNSFDENPVNRTAVIEKVLRIIFDNADILYISRIGSESDKCLSHIDNVLKKRFTNVRMKEVRFRATSVSSTEIRKLISEGIKDASLLGISDKVMQYILTNNLYKEEVHG